MKKDIDLFDSGIFKELGITRKSVLEFDKMLDERAKSRVPNDKFKTIEKAVNCAKRIAKENEATISVEYCHSDAVITIEGFLFDFHYAFDTLELLKELIALTDIVSIARLIDEKIQLSFDIKEVFDM